MEIAKLVPSVQRRVRRKSLWCGSTSSSPSAARPGRLGRRLGSLTYYLSIPLIQVRQALHNGWGILNVWDLILLRPMPGGLLDEDHPFCTGIDSRTGTPVWHENLLYCTPRAARNADGSPLPEEPDAAVIESVGRYLARIVRRSARRPGLPHGKPTRMPPAVQYIHGCVHYNSGWLLFNDVDEAIFHLTDRRFVRELCRFVRQERREPLLVFRRKAYDARSYEEFIGFVRSVFPWFANSNGAGKAPLWGNTSPYPAVNIVTGNWIRDTRMLRNEAGRANAPRPPVPRGLYFRDGPYAGERSTTLWAERQLARFHRLRIRARGERGNVYFVDRRRWARGFRYDPAQVPTLGHLLRERLAHALARRSPEKESGP